ncbi:MAG: hypothetical protein ACD_22C00045G0003 [uncultured bacterium]|nr:MAG: hypothetical protein ACD_22C00045G0003 [uncultured bacterium]
MKIEDIKNIAESLLEIPPIGNEVTTIIYSINFTSRHPSAPCYKNPHSIQKMVDDGVLKLIKQGEDGQPAPNASAIHYFANYKVSFNHDDLKKYLSGLKNMTQEEKIKQTEKEIYQWKELTLDLERFTLQYKDNPPLEKISLTREIRLLRLLMKKPGNIVYYLEVAKEVGIDIGSEEVNPNSVNKDVAQDIQTIRQDLIDNFLIPAGIPGNIAKTMIINVRNSGYKLG